MRELIAFPTIICLLIGSLFTPLFGQTSADPQILAEVRAIKAIDNDGTAQGC